MAYATAQDLVDRFGGEEMLALAPGEIVLDADGEPTDTAAEATPKLTAALEDASAEVDAKLAKAYALPLPDGTYRLLRKVAVDLARTRLYDDQVPERVDSRAKIAMEVLGAFVSGQVELVESEGNVIARRATAQVVSRERTFLTGAGATGELRGLDLL